MAQVGEYQESHMEPVVQLAFHPTEPSHLVSAGEDGLLCVFDTRIAGAVWVGGGVGGGMCEGGCP